MAIVPLVERRTAAWSLHISLPPSAVLASCTEYLASTSISSFAYRQKLPFPISLFCLYHLRSCYTLSIPDADAELSSQNLQAARFRSSDRSCWLQTLSRGGI